MAGAKWAYTIKRNDDGSDKYKARCVAKGSGQKGGVGKTASLHAPIDGEIHIEQAEGYKETPDTQTKWVYKVERSPSVD